MVCIVSQESLLREYINLKYKQTTECIDEIYNIVTNGLKAGGIEPTEIKIYAVMQQRNIEDFDRHALEIFNMNTSQFSSKPPTN
jgi:predicted lactoylglutathione lyase